MWPWPVMNDPDGGPLEGQDTSHMISQSLGQVGVHNISVANIITSMDWTRILPFSTSGLDIVKIILF